MDVKVICNDEHKYAVVDENGNYIVPFGTYGWIDDFNRGYAIVRKSRSGLTQVSKAGKKYWVRSKSGIIDVSGNLVIPIEFDEIWRLHEGYDRMVLYRDSNNKYFDSLFAGLQTYGGRPKDGSVYFDVRDGKIYSTPSGPLFNI